MNLITVGINHKTAPIEVREKFFLNSTEQDLLLSELKCNPSVAEALVLSTCNRTEIYANVLSDQNHLIAFIKLLADIKKVKFHFAETPRYFYTYMDQEAVCHFFRVTTGMDSLVLGEKQILGQVKEAVQRSRTKAVLGKSFHILSNLAIRSGKKAHTETDISYGGSSISWAAIMMAEKILGTLEGKSILVIGAGKMGELAMGHIRNKAFANVYVMNRTQSIACELAGQFNARAVGFCDIKEILASVDICICSVGAPHYIIEAPLIEKVMASRSQRPLTLIDISMPRNIDPLVAKIPQIHLCHIDDLEKVVMGTMQKRQQAMGCVEQIIETKIEEFYAKMKKIQTHSGHPDFTIPSKI